MNNRKLKFLSAPYAVWAAGFIVIPLCIILFYAFTSKEGGFTLANITAVAERGNVKALVLSMILSLISTAICLLLAYPLALILTNRRVGRGSFVILIFILPMWMNFLLRTLAWQSLLEKNGIINSLLSLSGLPPLKMINTPYAIVFGMVYNFLPFMVLPICNALEKIDRNVINAAKDLGADNIQTFWRIIFPLSMPGVISGITMVFVPALTTFVISDILGGGKILLIGNIIEKEFTQDGSWNSGSGLSFVLMIFIVISMAVTAKYDSEGTML